MPEIPEETLRLAAECMARPVNGRRRLVVFLNFIERTLWSELLRSSEEPLFVFGSSEERASIFFHSLRALLPDGSP